MKPTDREIERTQPTTPAPVDPGAGLREHVEGHTRVPLQRRAVGDAPVPEPGYVYDLRNANGAYMGSANDQDVAVVRARAIKGCVTASPIIADFRPQ